MSQAARKRSGPTLSLLEWRNEDAVRPARKQAGEVGLAHLASPVAFREKQTSKGRRNQQG
jgi:hypothetical protein